MEEELKIQAEKLPDKPGVYFFKDKDSKIIYVGKSINLKNRLRSYFKLRQHLGPKTLSMIEEAREIGHILVDSEVEALLLEASLIKKYQPKYNVIWKDDKSHLYIKITIGERIPIITPVRREEGKEGILLFGPFPRASVVRGVLKTLRRIFPFCQHSRKQKSCLWVHLGLCPDPYRGPLGDYRKNIRNIILVLSGQSKKVINKLEKEMKVSSMKEEFEKAAKIKKQIEDLKYLLQSYRTPEEYLEKPSLYEDLVERRLKDLASVLNLAKMPQRIEAIDISNIMGQQATGSLIVFQNGQRDRSWYRRFKIKSKNTPDDVTMIKEVLTRRLKNKWPLPDLIVIDGGLGQLNGALRVLDQFGLKIPTIALAKREEEIYQPGRKETVKLKKDSAALQLIQEIRDEAHRFALSYHRKLREKAFLS